MHMLVRLSGEFVYPGLTFLCSWIHALLIMHSEEQVFLFFPPSFLYHVMRHMIQNSHFVKVAEINGKAPAE